MQRAGGFDNSLRILDQTLGCCGSAPSKTAKESGYAMQPLVLHINEGKKHPLSAFSFNIL